ncbi:unnamed protein product [Vicia faba]|uniref:Uncharacterized protein n=1 Tax=Vicia faba TaxID=3906 RepID=A0AAV1B7C3_VICFA|nr:unnamed protein product [Vicia faba]
MHSAVKGFPCLCLKITQGNNFLRIVLGVISSTWQVRNNFMFIQKRFLNLQEHKVMSCALWLASIWTSNIQILLKLCTLCVVLWL